MTGYHKVLFLLLISFLSLSYPVSAQSLEKRIDSLIRTEFIDNNGPGGVFMAAKGGTVIYEKAFGKANIELGVDMDVTNVFQLGSMTKQFTAVAILQLEQQGKLKVSDPVVKYLADYPQGEKITLHHLLTHTSGVKDFTKMKALSGIAQQKMSPKMMVDFFKNEPVDFAPGEKFEYNNSGYVLLGYIIELVSGENYESYITKHIFQKAGMHNSQYADERKIIKNRAYGYQEKENGYVNKSRIDFSVPFSSGSLMSTAEDLLKWQNALNRYQLLPKATIDQAFRKYKLNNSDFFAYGYGWHLKEINGIPDREHGGSIFGFKTMGVYVPVIDLYVIGLSNCDCHSPTELTKRIASIVIEELKKIEARK